MVENETMYEMYENAKREWMDAVDAFEDEIIECAFQGVRDYIFFVEEELRQKGFPEEDIETVKAYVERIDEPGWNLFHGGDIVSIEDMKEFLLIGVREFLSDYETEKTEEEWKSAIEEATEKCQEETGFEYIRGNIDEGIFVCYNGKEEMVRRAPKITDFLDDDEIEMMREAGIKV